MTARSVLLVTTALVAACSSSKREGPHPAAEEPAVSLPVCIKEYFSGLSWPGTRVAIHGRDDIAPRYTNELGCTTLRGVPAESEVLISFTAPGLTPTLCTWVTGETDSAELRMDLPAAEWRRVSANAFSFALDYSRGSLSVYVTFNNAPTISAEGGVPSVALRLWAPFEAGPFFNEGATAWAPADTPATSESGIGAFFNVDPGDAELELELPPGVECVVGYDDVWSSGGSWPAAKTPPAGTLRVRVPIYAGFHTGIAIRCFH